MVTITRLRSADIPGRIGFCKARWPFRSCVSHRSVRLFVSLLLVRIRGELRLNKCRVEISGVIICCSIAFRNVYIFNAADFCFFEDSDNAGN